MAAARGGARRGKRGEGSAEGSAVAAAPERSVFPLPDTAAGVGQNKEIPAAPLQRRAGSKAERAWRAFFLY